MLCSEEYESPHRGPFGHEYDENYECDGCGRGIIARFGGVPPTTCDSCEADFEREMKAGHLEFG